MIINHPHICSVRVLLPLIILLLLLLNPLLFLLKIN